MIQTSSKKDRRIEREHKKLKKIEKDLQEAVLSFASKKHAMFQEWEASGHTKGGIDDPPIEKFKTRRDIAQKRAGKRVKPFVSGEVLDPIEPIKLRKGTKLVMEDTDREFKEPIVSPAMQRNLRNLELRIDSKGRLYSPKAFDPNWNWQTQAIWLRLIGLGYTEIANKIKKSLNTVKSMFKRLGISKFLPRVSRHDWSTIGFGAANTPSGWKAILHGGCSGMLYPSSEAVINEQSGTIRPTFLARFNVGEMIGKEYTLETEPFNFKEHQKEVIQSLKEETEQRELITLEQKTAEIENLQKNIALGFDPITGTYET